MHIFVVKVSVQALVNDVQQSTMTQMISSGFFKTLIKLDEGFTLLSHSRENMPIKVVTFRDAGSQGAEENLSTLGA